jgi:hypothetical protein
MKSDFALPATLKKDRDSCESTCLKERGIMIGIALMGAGRMVRCRLRHARQLIALEGNRRSLAEIAWAAGFFDQAHLTRHFQRALGQSPGQWRQQILCKTGLNFPGFVLDAWLTVRPD